MKIECSCGRLVVDQTDALPHKAHLIADEDWFALFDQIDAAVESAHDHRMTRDQAQHEVRRLLTTQARSVRQCAGCGRLFVDDAAGLPHVFAPEISGATPAPARAVLQGRARR